MSATVEASVDLVASVEHWRLPPKEDDQLQELMDANTNGTLTAKTVQSWEQGQSTPSDRPAASSTRFAPTATTGSNACAAWPHRNDNRPNGESL